MVRLKLTGSVTKPTSQASLNSTMVRLKREFFMTRYNWFSKSQFHYGSIKTILKFWIDSEGNRLNSTMVRLKRLKTGQISPACKPSQFHYGSIKTDPTIIYNKQDFLSQFHYGSIKT